MRLAVVSHKQHFNRNGGFYTTGGFGRSMEFIARHVDELIVAVPVDPIENVEGFYQYAAKNITVFPLPGVKKAYEFLYKALPLARTLRKGMPFWDVVALYMPGEPPIVAHAVGRNMRKNMFLMVMGDAEEVLRKSYTTGWKKYAARAMSRFYGGCTMRMARQCPTIVVGDALQEKMRAHGISALKTADSTLSAKDISPERDTCTGDGIRILYVGRLAAEKGLLDLFDALEALLRDSGRYRLTVVGDGPLRSPLEQRAASPQLAGRIEFLGNLPWSYALLDVYRSSDVFVLASYSEGIPKVLIEAMASSLPVVATNVGGIPTIVRDGVNGRLVPSHSSAAIAAAVREIVENAALRREFIRNGLAVASANTMDAEVELMFKVMRDNGFIK